MIAETPTRRTVVISGLLGTATLSGCSMADLTRRKVEDPEAADRARIQQARDLSSTLRATIEGATAADRRASVVYATFVTLHAQQIAAFTRTAGLAPPTSLPTATTGTLTAADLRSREHTLAQSLRSLALDAQSGHVAALLASAAAGIDQELSR